MVLDIVAATNSSLVSIEALGYSETLKIGKKISYRGILEVSNFLKGFWEQLIAKYESITRVSLDHLGNVTITLGEGPDIRLGRDPVDRFKALDKVIPILDGQNRSSIQYIDLQYDQIIVKRKS